MNKITFKFFELENWVQLNIVKHASNYEEKYLKTDFPVSLISKEEQECI